jgi:hypothetical protein
MGAERLDGPLLRHRHADTDACIDYRDMSRRAMLPYAGFLVSRSASARAGPAGLTVRKQRAEWAPPCGGFRSPGPPPRVRPSSLGVHIPL